MPGEAKKTKSGRIKGGMKSLGPDGLDRIDEYNFFLAQDGEEAEGGVPEGKAKKKKQNDRNKSMTFFLSK